MKIALAQINERLGDIQAICERLESQARLASDRGADLLCLPEPLLCGMFSQTLLDYSNYQHAVLSALCKTADRLSDLSLICLVPVALPYEDTSMFEIAMLKRGRVVPMRSLAAIRRSHAPVDPWTPPIFDVAGVRVACTFDTYRDIDGLPSGCDLLIEFANKGFDSYRVGYTGVASVSEGCYRKVVVKKGIWLAYMAPLGGYDEDVYTGGSFVMDDAGRVVAAAHCFEEDLLIQEVRRGQVMPAIEDHELPVANREQWLWEALRLHLTDYIRQSCIATNRSQRVVVHLKGDLPSSLLAALAVDSLGPRNVIGVRLSHECDDAAQRSQGDMRVGERIRFLAESLGIAVTDRSISAGFESLDSDAAGRPSDAILASLERACIDDVASSFNASVLSDATKTDKALSPQPQADRCVLAPFGDVYLSVLEHLARYRNGVSDVIPQDLVALAEIEACMSRIVARVVRECDHDAVHAGRIASALYGLKAYELDDAMAQHIENGLSFEENPRLKDKPEALALLMLLVRSAEAARRRTPPSPAVSKRPFSERQWPIQLGWSDTGRSGEKPLTTEGLIRRELRRQERRGREAGKRMRGEIAELIGGMLGISPEQLEYMASEEGQAEMAERFRRMTEQMGEQGMEPPKGLQGGSTPATDLPFFSIN